MMSMHKIPLTPIEEAGLKEHGLDIGTPSQLSDVFRQGIKWAQYLLRTRVAELEALSVTNILMRVVPGDDGMGQEVCAKSVDEVVAELTKQSERIAVLEAENARLIEHHAAQIQEAKEHVEAVDAENFQLLNSTLPDLSEVEAMRRYREYAAILCKFIESIDFDDTYTLPRDVWAIVQFFGDTKSIDAAMFAAGREGE